MFALGKRLAAHTVFHIPCGGYITNAIYNLSTEVEVLRLSLYIANAPLCRGDKDISADVKYIGLNNAKKIGRRLYRLLCCGISPSPTRPFVIVYNIAGSASGSQIDFGRRIYREGDVGEYKYSIGEPCPAPFLSDELKMRTNRYTQAIKASRLKRGELKLYLPSEKCNICISRTYP